MSVLGITMDMLKEWQLWPLERKIAKSRQTILDWYKHYNGEVYISFSGGKDSSVMLHMVRKFIKEEYPDAPPVEAVFSNTGLEFPEIVEFVKTIPDVTIVRPKMTYLEVVKKYGYALVSKEQAYYIYQARTTKSEKLRHKRLHGSGEKKGYKIAEKWKKLIDAPFKISDKCCEKLKKQPFKDFTKKSGKVPYVGVMAGESRLRINSYLRYGCNAYTLSSPQSRPLGHWNEADIWEYIGAFGVPICTKIYNDMGYPRTGCMWCAFGADQETNERGENRFQRLKRTHPKIWKYCMDKMGLRKPLEYIGVPVDTEYDYFKQFNEDEKDD